MGHLGVFKFIKYSGAGNTFIITAFDKFKDVDLQSEEFRKTVQNFCSPLFGPGADGFLILTELEKSNYKWDFYNSDGSSAEMCGNASRCAALFCLDFFHERNVLFRTVAGPVRVKALENNLFETAMPPAIVTTEKQLLEIEAEKVEVFFCNTGVPHAVIFCKSVSDKDRIVKWASKIRNHAAWGKPGANATFLWKNEQGIYCAETFERGVEAITLACGTGAVAAALKVENLMGETKILIEMPGGQLHVDLTNKSAPLLTGPAIKICEFIFGENE